MTPLVYLILFLSRHITAGILVVFQGDVTQLRGKIRQIFQTQEALQSSGFDRLQLTRPVPSRPKPLLYCPSCASAAKAMHPDPKGSIHPQDIFGPKKTGILEAFQQPIQVIALHFWALDLA
ncbi:hypothetical protein J7443_02230 [Tropicibacter sp. R15_0]|uniref:hypothetical protein n=1 Tax=Tropicibacter sp. R15_0 TaxID=2821101 RepID=UPI001AD95965|nr:hypothetical protein [Tropicibacter sp. R15_0]MBO9464033.1 hypothetical protein [Tropicibacter sp. R15_0]